MTILANFCSNKQNEIFYIFTILFLFYYQSVAKYIRIKCVFQHGSGFYHFPCQALIPITHYDLQVLSLLLTCLTDLSNNECGMPFRDNLFIFVSQRE